MFIFYPILRAPNCQGRTIVHNYPPNNWEVRKNYKKNINITWSDGFIWRSKIIGSLDIDKSFVIKEEDLEFLPNGALALSSLSINELPSESMHLPEDIDMQTHLPEWRASIGLESILGANTSFQGEGHAFPSNGSLLSFSPFLQNGPHLSNYLLFINIEKSPIFRNTKLYFLKVNGSKIEFEISVTSNHINIIKLDDLGYQNNEIMVLLTKNIVGIPLFMTSYNGGKELSLEHTHPPASFAIHGDRWGLHSELKKIWAEKFNNIIKSLHDQNNI
tara:strand:- start:306 stop:1127 length:822 start_codon:yes stop_codon:yes gene_type:complete